MIFFTDEEINSIRKKAEANPSYISRILKETEDIRKRLYIQKTGLATWGHYYMCPKHTVRLIFNYDDPKHHICPIDGEALTGEPYDGSWWRTVADKNCTGAFMLAAAYLATGDEGYLKTVKEILLGYAKYYPSYEVHGGIPYNNPGKMAAQVLCDSNLITSLAKAYAIMKNTLDKDEQEFIEKNLFAEAAEHIKKYATPQIHNHEVFVFSALGIIGLVTDNEELCDYAINAKYGLRYQLDHALLEDGLWFEVSIAYHTYAMIGFMNYECFARHTRYSLFADEHTCTQLYRMLNYPKKIRYADNSFPAIGDGDRDYRDLDCVYEYAYTYFRNAEMLDELNAVYEDSERNGVYALLFGVDEIPSYDKPASGNYLSASGIGFIREKDKTLFYKGTPFAGEHDHYDRMSVGLSAYGKPICEDLGTASGYGAPLHYSYFKNTATHNTVVINGDNMPPAETRILEFADEEDGNVTLDAMTEWTDNYKMPDSFTIKQWVDESYQGVKMRRIVRWYGKYFIDVFEVLSDNALKKEWVWHTDGVTDIPDGALSLGAPWTKEPQSKLHNAYSIPGEGVMKISYDCDGVALDIHAYAEGKEIIFARGPNNPSTSDISYLFERTCDKNTVYVNVIEAHKGESLIENVNIDIQNGLVSVKLKETNGKTVLYKKQL